MRRENWLPGDLSQHPRTQTRLSHAPFHRDPKQGPADFSGTPDRPLHPVFHRDVGAFQLLRDARPAVAVHGELFQVEPVRCFQRLQVVHLAGLCHSADWRISG